jgi:transcriptional regulator with XRE-family HTH domain
MARVSFVSRRSTLLAGWRKDPMDTAQSIAIRNRIIGILVKRARLKTGKSQQACAEFLGCSPFMFSQYEQGRRGLSLPQLEALAYLFDVPPACLWDETQSLPGQETEDVLPMVQLMHLRRKELAIRFRQCRETAGKTQAETGQMLGRSAYIISQYEHGRRDIPLAEFETIMEQCGQTPTDLFDEQMISIGQADQTQQTLARLNELSPDVREFALNPTNTLYLRIAILLSALKADSLRQIAETILDITY